MKNLWVIDDDLILHFILKKKFEKEKDWLKARFIVDPTEAVREFNNAEKDMDNLPVVVLLDINMPQMTGWEVIEHIRSLGLYESPRCPKIIMFTSSISYSDQTRANQNEVKLITKPLNEADIQNIKDYVLSSSC